MCITFIKKRQHHVGSLKMCKFQFPHVKYFSTDWRRRKVHSFSLYWTVVSVWGLNQVSEHLEEEWPADCNGVKRTSPPQNAQLAPRTLLSQLHRPAAVGTLVFWLKIWEVSESSLADAQPQPTQTWMNNERISSGKRSKELNAATLKQFSDYICLPFLLLIFWW